MKILFKIKKKLYNSNEFQVAYSHSFILIYLIFIFSTSVSSNIHKALVCLDTSVAHRTATAAMALAAVCGSEDRLNRGQRQRALLLALVTQQIPVVDELNSECITSIIQCWKLVTDSVFASHESLNLALIQIHNFQSYFLNTSTIIQSGSWHLLEYALLLLSLYESDVFATRQGQIRKLRAWPRPQLVIDNTCSTNIRKNVWGDLTLLTFSIRVRNLRIMNNE